MRGGDESMIRSSVPATPFICSGSLEITTWSAPSAFASSALPGVVVKRVTSAPIA
jgi:hypothetical protein